MPLGSVHGVLHSTAFVVARDLVVLVAVVVWLAQAHWVNRDARRRLDDSWLVVTATLLALVPFVGVLLYLLFRPAETLADVQVRELELRALSTALAPRQPECPVCRLVVEPGYLVCPVCATRLKHACGECDTALDPLWQVCPYCGAGAVAPVTELRLTDRT